MQSAAVGCANIKPREGENEREREGERENILKYFVTIIIVTDMYMHN